LNNKTEYDDYIDAQTGQIELQKLCGVLSMALWGLIMAKARAIFQISDILEPEKMKKKYQ